MAKSKEIKKKIEELQMMLDEHEAKEAELEEPRAEIKKKAQEIYEDTADEAEGKSIIELIDDAEPDDDEPEANDLSDDSIAKIARALAEQLARPNAPKGMGLPHVSDSEKRPSEEAIRHKKPKKKAKSPQKQEQQHEQQQQTQQQTQQQAPSKPVTVQDDDAQAQDTTAGAVVAGAEARPKKPQPQLKAPKSQPAESKSEAPDVTPVASAATLCHPDGPGKAYKYWSSKTNSWGLTPDYWAAIQIAGDMWSAVWVYYKNGVIHHLLDEEEIIRYLPH